MSKTTNRVLSMVLTVLMLCSMLTVFAMADATPFAETYDGTVIPKTALLVDDTITEADEATVTRTWDGNEYTFVVGVNAFKSLTDAYAFARDNEIASPAIIVTGWTGAADLTIEMASDVYAPNWNTAPMNEMTEDFDAIASEGADWTENTTYTANQITIGSLKATADVVGSAAAYGFTVTNKVDVASARNNDSEAVNFLVKNTVLDAVNNTAENSNVINVNNNKSAEATDTLTLKNFWLKKVGSGVRARVFADGGFRWPNIVFDGMYANLSTMGICAAGGGSNDHLKTEALDSSVVFKNSNLRKSDPATTAYWQVDRACPTSITDNTSYTRTIEFDNNVMVDFNNGGAIINNNYGTDARYFGYPQKVTVTDNFVLNTVATKIAGATGKVHTKSGDELIDFEVTGNKLLGVTAQTYSDADVANNFWVAEAKETVDEYKALAGAQYAGTGAYYADYNMQYAGAGLLVSDVETQGVDSVDGFNITILYEGTPDAKLTIDSFITGDPGDKQVTKTLSKVADFSTTIEEYDVATLLGTETLYLKVAYDETYCNIYTITMYDTQVESFNEKLEDGLEINGVEFTVDDTAVYLPKNAVIGEVGDDYVTYLKFAGTTYKFIVDNENVYDNEGGDLTALDSFEGGKIIFPAGDYNSVTLTVAADYYGANFGIDPIDKSGASATNNYDWALNENWDLANDSVFYQIGISATITGEDLTLDGVTVSLFVDNARGNTAEPLYTTIINSVFEAYNGNTGNGDAAIHLNNPRATTTEQNVAADNDDSFTAKNVYFKSITSNQLVHERVVPNVTFDNVYLDAQAAGKKRAVLGFFKTNSLIPAFITFKNSNFRNGTNANNLFLVAGATAGATNNYVAGDLTEVVIDNNIVYNGQGANAVPMIVPNISSVCSLAVTNNTIIDTTGVASLFGTQNYANVAVADSPLNGNITIDNNTIAGIGVASATVNFGFGENNPVMTNTYYSSTVAGLTSPATATGEYIAAMGTNDYWLDYGKTVKASELKIVDAQPGTSDVLVSAVAHETKSFIVTLGDSRTTDGMVVTVGDKATGKLLDANKEEIAAATAAGTYYYRVISTTTPTVYSDYEVTVLGAPAQPFISSYNLDNSGEIKASALLVDTSITEAAGTVIERKWEGVFYKFTVGSNAFASLDAAYAYVGDADLDDAQIIVTNYSGQLIVKQPYNIYAPNWNTAPMNEMGDMTKVGANADGIDWTNNPAYAENELAISDIIFAGGFECEDGEFVKVAGFTVTGFISTDAYGLTGDLVRLPGETLNAEIVNTVVNTTKFAFDHHYEAKSDAVGAQYLEEDDSLIVRNMRYDMCGGRFWNGDGAVPSYLEIDGLYVDFSDLPLTANTFMKKAGAHAKTIVKNSNLRGTTPGEGNMGLVTLAAWSGASYNYDEDFGYSYEVEIDNNTLVYETYNALKEGDVYTGNYRQLYFEGDKFTGLSITNNYMDRKGNTAERVYSSVNGTVGGNLSAVNPEWTDTTVTVFTGNKVVGYPLTEKWAKDDKVEAYGNYFAAEVREDGNYANVPGGCPTMHTGGVTDTWFYYLDYDMTVKSNIIYDGYSIVDAGKNMIVSKDATADEEGVIIYAYDDKVVNNEGTITVDFSHVIDGVHANNSATIYTADASADAETETLTLTADANNEAEFKLSVWSHDKTKAITWNVKIQAPTHAWGEWTELSGATCEDLAVEKRECDPDDCMINDNCTESETREVGELADCLVENYTVSSNASCEAAGTLSGTCKWCGTPSTIDNPEDPKKDHAGDKVTGQAATCTVDGWKDYYECTVGCDKFYADEEFTTVIEDLDAWKAGEGKIAAGHKTEKVTGQAATCTVDGWKDYYECTVCEKLFADEAAAKEIEDLDAWKVDDGKIAAGHTWGEYVYNNDATEEADGTKTRECSVCHEKETVTAEGTKIEKPSVEIKDTSKIFKDVKKGWYKDAVDYAYSYGFIAGMSDTEFGLNTNVTRGMFITILARIAGVETTGSANKVTTKFADVKSGKWYAAAIKWANENAIVNGTSDTAFSPDAAISRQDLCVMVVNYAKFMNVELTAVEDEITFKDASSIRNYAKNAVKVCQMADIVNGYTDGTFGPTKTATRAEAAVILYKLHANFMVK